MRRAALSRRFARPNGQRNGRGDEFLEDRRSHNRRRVLVVGSLAVGPEGDLDTDFVLPRSSIRTAGAGASSTPEARRVAAWITFSARFHVDVIAQPEVDRAKPQRIGGIVDDAGGERLRIGNQHDPPIIGTQPSSPLLDLFDASFQVSDDDLVADPERA